MSFAFLIGIDMLAEWKRLARELKVEVYALYLAYRDPRVPLYARIFGALVVGYALSPIDLIPDPIPILGYIDDLVIVPLGIWLSLKMIPAPVMDECRVKARETIRTKPVNRAAAFVIVAIWILTAALVIAFIWRNWS